MRTKNSTWIVGFFFICYLHFLLVKLYIDDKAKMIREY